MKKHTFDDGSVAYFYEIGDKVVFTKKGSSLCGLDYKKGQSVIVRGHKEYKNIFNKIKISTLVSFVLVQNKNYAGFVPCWDLKPFDPSISMEEISLP